MPDGDLLTLAGLLAVLSVLSVGGGPRIMAPLAHEAVSVHGWMTGETLIRLYGLSRLLPGAGGLILLSGLVGGAVGGPAGALLMPLALLLPSALLCFAAVPRWLTPSGSGWKTILARAAGPVAVGQGMAGGIAILQFAHTGRGGLALAGAAFLGRMAGLPAPLVLALGAAGGAALSLV